MTSEAPRKVVGMTPMIKSSSPRMPIKAKITNVYGFHSNSNNNKNNFKEN